MNAMRIAVRVLVVGLALVAGTEWSAQAEELDNPRLEELSNEVRQVGELQRKGKYAEALQHQLQVVKILKETRGEDNYTYMSSLQGLASLYNILGQGEAAAQIRKRSEEIQQRLIDRANNRGIPQIEEKNEDSRIAEGHKELAESLRLQQLGKFEDVLPHQLRVVELLGEVYGEDSEESAIQSNRLAAVYKALGQYAKAEPLFKQGLAKLEKKLGPDHINVAACLNNFAALYDDMGQYDKAEPFYLRSLKIWDEKLGHDHANVAYNLNNLGALYFKKQEYAKAQSMFEQSLAICKSKQETDPLQVAQCLNQPWNPIHGNQGLYPSTSVYSASQSNHGKASRRGSSRSD